MIQFSLYGTYDFKLHDLLPIALALLSLISVFYYCGSIYASTSFFTQPKRVNSNFQPAVSILKPICGVDQNSYENLASFCNQSYSSYQIIFAVQDAFDPCIIVIKQLIRDFPEQDLHLVVSDRTIGINPKVNNLANALLEAKHDLLLLADSDIQVKSDFLARVVQPFYVPSVGVVTCMYRSRTNSAIAAFEALSISTEFLPSVLMARQLEGISFALGAVIAMPKSVLADIGGFNAIANYLGDDFRLGNLPAQAGHQVILSDYVVDHTLDTKTFAEFLTHQTRWLRGNRFVRPWGYTGLIFTYGIANSLFLLLVTSGATFAWIIFVTTVVARMTMAWKIGVHDLEDEIAKRCFWLIPLRDLVSFGLWCNGFMGNTVMWRGKRFKLAKSGRLIAPPPSDWIALETPKVQSTR